MYEFDLTTFFASGSNFRIIHVYLSSNCRVTLQDVRLTIQLFYSLSQREWLHMVQSCIEIKLRIV